MKRTYRNLTVAGCVLYTTALLIPVWALLSGAVSGQQPETTIGSRRLLLLANSIKLGGTAAALACLTGLLCALYIRNSKWRNKWYRYFFVLFLPVPYYIYALAWMYLVRFLSYWQPGILRYCMQGFGACLFVEVLTYLPLATLFLLTALESVNAETEKMALVYRGPMSVLIHQTMPEIGPFLAAAAGCIFTLSAADFSVPSMFQYNTYALEIYSVYGRTGNALQAGLLSWPLMVVLCLPTLFIARGISKIGFPQACKQNIRRVYPAGVAFAMKSAFIIQCIQVAVPAAVFALYTEGLDGRWRSFDLIREQLTVSLEIAAVSAVLSLILTAGPAAALAATDSPILWMAGLISAVFPGALQAMGLLAAVNGSVFHWISRTILLPALGCAIRYMPFGLLVMATAIRRLDKRRLEMARIMAVRESAYTGLALRMLLPGIFCSAGLVFFLALGEEGIMLVLMPPGLETASVKIYNYLHYGASQYVAGFCLVMVLAMAAIELAGIAVLRRCGKGGSDG